VSCTGLYVDVDYSDDEAQYIINMAIEDAFAKGTDN
jgi:hypothetical protein